jgi:CheY-like chemotaxis protein
MSVHNALRDLASLIPGEPSAAELAAQARRLGELENSLGQPVAQGGKHIEAVGRTIKQPEQNVGANLAELSQRLISGSLPDSEAVKNVDEAALTSNAITGHVRPIVLVVDDDEFQHKIVGKLLEAENYQLIFASDGFEALNLLRKTRPDVILMDVMMPGMDGMETTRRLKATPQSAKTPVIMITGKSEGKVVIDSLKAGAVDFVVKPFDRAILIAKIARVLSASTSSLPP